MRVVVPAWAHDGMDGIGIGDNQRREMTNSSQIVRSGDDVNPDP